MKETLAVDLQNELSYTVTIDMKPGHIPAPVLSTPSMVSLIEGTCLQNVLEHLDEGETTVGTHICVSHAGAAYVDEDVTITTRLKKITKRRLLFDVTVASPRGSISEGTHERAVVTQTRLNKD